KGEFNSDFHPMVDFIVASPLRRNLKLRDEDGIVSIPDTELFKNLTLMGPKSTGFNEFSSNIATALVCLATNRTYNFFKMIFDGMVKNINNKTSKFLIQYTRRARITQSSALPTVADEPASLVRDVCEGEACPTESGFIADQDRATIAKASSTQTFIQWWILLQHPFSGLFPLFDTMLEHQGEGSGTPTEPHHTPSPEADTSHLTTSSIPLPSIPTGPISPVTQPDTTPIRQYSRRARLAQSSALPTVADELASPVRDVSQGEACPTNSGFIADQDRETIAKSSTLPHDSAPRVTSPAADEGNMQHNISELTALYTSLEGVPATQSGDDAPIKGRSINEGEAAAERIIGPTTSLIVTKRKGKEVMVESDTLKKKKLQEQIDAQVAREIDEKQEKDNMRMNEQITRDAEVARIHVEEELQGMIDSLDYNLVKYQDNYSKVYKFQSQQRRPMTKKQKREYYMAVIKSNLGWKVEDFIPIGSKEETERLKRKGLNLEKKQLVPVEDVYVQALEFKHPIIDWKVHTEGQRSYWQIIRLGGSSACYQFFVDLLKQLDREDLNQLWDLMKEYLSIRPATCEKEIELWVELKRMYEPDPEDQLWTLKQNFMHAPVEWKLYDLSGVHHLTAKDKEIFMLIAEDLIRKIYNIANTQRQYTRRARTAQSSALPTIADEPASPMRDVSEGEACSTESGFIADQDRATIAKSSTLPHDSVPRVTSPAANEGSNTAKQSGDDALIKGRSINEGDAAAERISNDSEEIARVLTSMDAATVLAGEIDVLTGSGSIPTADPPATIISIGSEVGPTASPIVTRRKGKEIMVESDTSKKKQLQEQIDAQVARELEEQQEKEDMRMNEQIARDAEYLQEYQEFALELPLEKRIELISDLVKYQEHYTKVEDFIPMGSKEETKRLKRKGLNLENEQVKKQKSSEEALEIEISNEEFTEEKIKEMMQLVLVEDVYVQALQVKHPIIDWKVHTEDPEDQLWTLTQNFMHAPVEWKLYDLSGVHHLTAKDKEIFMLVEKDYPLRKGLALVMISYKFQVENYSQIAEDLIRKICNIANTPREQGD
nr:hypothetical protein [Tanacetum cinerariifolium]